MSGWSGNYKGLRNGTLELSLWQQAAAAATAAGLAQCPVWRHDQGVSGLCDRYAVAGQGSAGLCGLGEAAASGSSTAKVGAAVSHLHRARSEGGGCVSHLLRIDHQARID